MMRPFSSDLEGQARRSKVTEFSTKKWERTHLSASFWNKMIVISCAIAISLDPLFLYIPFIDGEKKCLGMDKKLRNVALILRSVTDITFLVDIGYTIYEGMKKAYTDINEGDEIIPFAKNLARELEWCSLVTDLLSVFPMPQLLVVKVFSKMRGRGYLERRKVLNSFLLSQYFARIGRIILSSKQLTWTTGIRMKAVFNLFLYILASHVLGALWYFFSIQREISCWYWACKKHPYHEGCMSTFYCDDHITSTTVIAFLNESCGTDVPDNTKPLFDYGIFLDSLEIGNTRHVHFPTKLCYCFWWGLRNLSNFGTNLTTSNYAWENFFAILTSITGLLLFVYLIGNVQIFIQMETTKSEKLKQKNFFDQIKQKIELKGPAIEAWMAKNGIPDDMKKEIMENINQKLKEDKDADLENLFNVLPWYTKKSLKRFLCLNILSQVQLLKEMDDQVLKMMCDYLMPVTYPENKIIFRKGDPMDRMLLIIEGTLLRCSTNPDPSLTHGGETKEDSGSMATNEVVEKREVYGEELLTWASASGQFNLPTCPENVRCHTNVEGFALSAMDLTSVASKCKRRWRLRKYFEENGGEHLKEATNNYAVRNEIGSGRYGIVYRGTSVASKRKRRWRRLRKYFKENGDKAKQKYSEANDFLVLQETMGRLGKTARIFTENEVKEATENYDGSKKVGEGRYGIVYKGILKVGESKQRLAIKKSKVKVQIDQNEITSPVDDLKQITQQRFIKEMIALYQISHKNIVRFVGCCLDTAKPILVYELMRRGTLYEHIHEKEGKNPSPLPLARRLKIAAETAEALAFLHHDTGMQIIHCDVKTANILLDENWTAKLSGFGASRLGPEDLDSKSNTLTEKSDVHSFGVVLAELLTGLEPQRNLAKVFVGLVEGGTLDKSLDEEIVEGHFDIVRKAADLAKRCLKPKAEERPSMKDVAAELNGLVRTMEQHPSGGGEADISPSPKDTGSLGGSSASSASAGDIITSAL
ncbi:hypothetical protein L3X38_022681 [Prunus dulcis]|uniref:Cyclic nucleotide gated channel 1 n=1 Tax=Prunus dulcis TaxID=3755 RepID=A0AAD4VZ62_PRUDU|nr:hypothetical protein L3X38_022681 [Prunus dulcis]